ncbi:MAG: GNAT family N-acetyltransferase [Rivularia sp. (in: cyanobacteria)]
MTTLLETKRLIIRRWIPENKQSNNTTTGAWAIVENDSERCSYPMKVSLHKMAEVGWHLRKASWGKGYATEAARKIINYGFNILQLSEIYAVVKPENHASVKVTQRLGMKHEGNYKSVLRWCRTFIIQIRTARK